MNGDETGLKVYVYEENEPDGTDYQDYTWADAAGVVTVTQNVLKVTASISTPVVVDVSKMNWIVVKQGGSDNDGTPTGTLAMDYTLTR